MASAGVYDFVVVDSLFVVAPNYVCFMFGPYFVL